MGTVIVDVVARYVADGYIRLSRICWESSRVSGVMRIVDAEGAPTSVTPYFLHSSRNRATATRSSAASGSGPYRSMSSSTTPAIAASSCAAASLR